MTTRHLDRERMRRIRRAIAVGQIVTQSDETRVGFWLTRDAEAAIETQEAPTETRARGRRAAVRVVRRGQAPEDPAPNP